MRTLRFNDFCTVRVPPLVSSVLASADLVFVASVLVSAGLVLVASVSVSAVFVTEVEVVLGEVEVVLGGGAGLGRFFDGSILLTLDSAHGGAGCGIQLLPPQLPTCCSLFS